MEEAHKQEEDKNNLTLHVSKLFSWSIAIRLMIALNWEFKQNIQFRGYPEGTTTDDHIELALESVLDRLSLYYQLSSWRETINDTTQENIYQLTMLVSAILDIFQEISSCHVKEIYDFTKPSNKTIGVKERENPMAAIFETTNLRVRIEEYISVCNHALQFLTELASRTGDPHILSIISFFQKLLLDWKSSFEFLDQYNLYTIKHLKTLLQSQFHKLFYGTGKHHTIHIADISISDVKKDDAIDQFNNRRRTEVYLSKGGTPMAAQKLSGHSADATLRGIQHRMKIIEWMDDSVPDWYKALFLLGITPAAVDNLWGIEVLHFSWSVDLKGEIFPDWKISVEYDFHISINPKVFSHCVINKEPIPWSYWWYFKWNEVGGLSEYDVYWTGTTSNNLYDRMYALTNDVRTNPERKIIYLEGYHYWLYRYIFELLIAQANEKIGELFNEREFLDIACEFSDLPALAKDKLELDKLAADLKSWRIDDAWLYKKDWSQLFSNISYWSSYQEATQRELLFFHTQAQALKGYILATVVDLGCWNWWKVSIIWDELKLNGNRYISVDSSLQMVLHSAKLLKQEHWDKIKIEWKPITFDQLDALARIKWKTFLMLWFTIGNFDEAGQREVLQNIYNVMRWGDNLIISAFLEQNEATIQRLYSNEEGQKFILSFFKKLWVRSDQMRHIVEYWEDKIVRIWVEFTEDVILVVDWQKIEKNKWERILAISSQRFTQEYLEDLFTSIWFELTKSLTSDDWYWVFILSKKKKRTERFTFRKWKSNRLL